MTIDERLRLPCGICGKGRNQHVGSVHGCPGGYGTYWNPDGERDERVWPRPKSESVSVDAILGTEDSRASNNIDGRATGEQRGDLDMYVIYDHPRDYPAEFVVRRWELELPREVIGSASTLEGARRLLPPGLVNIGRYAEDDPVIVETWER